ncbi:MAG TPA: TOBE domain-containing protein [Methylomirabilota bacterium]|nr:TOBE domain-containing protein [Methylomirabilota bacterium]
MTHDHHEALLLADRVAIMDRGRIEQVGTLENVRVGVRPEDVELSRERRDGSVSGVIAERASLALMGTTLFTIRVGAHEVHAHVTGDDTRQAGESVWLTFKRYHVFDRESGVRLRSYAGDQPSPA